MIYRFLLAALSIVVLADPAGARIGGGQGDMFANADTNKDGLVSRAEFVASRAAHFARFDRNGDGVVSPADFSRLARFPAIKAKADAMIAEADGNHDGVVTRAELANAPAAMFDRADTNHDGFVDKAEIAAFRAKAQAMRGAR